MIILIVYVISLFKSASRAVFVKPDIATSFSHHLVLSILLASSPIRHSALIKKHFHIFYQRLVPIGHV